MTSHDSTGAQERFALATAITREAGLLALDYARDRSKLAVTAKANAQDVVSAADKACETLLRDRIRQLFPDDGLLGEEFGYDQGSSGFTWVMDPVDGTSPFVHGLPSWCVSVGLKTQAETVAGVIYAPARDELFAALKGHGATLNGKRLHLGARQTLQEGLLGLGASHRIPPKLVAKFVEALLEQGGIFIRNGSGALMLAYVAAGRLVGYYEPHINAWDCLAGLCIIEEAGGYAEPFTNFEKGGRVVACNFGAKEELLALIEKAES